MASKGLLTPSVVFPHLSQRVMSQAPKINRPKVKTCITEVHLTLKILVFVLIVSFPQLKEERRLFLKEKLIKFGGFKNITLIWIKEQEFVTG